MYVDYTDLNKNCPKDPFWLPCINQVIDSIAGCILLCFLDCYSGYHQIALKEEDQIKTAFITSYCVCAYTTMSFGLKNVGAMYQWAIQLCFAEQLHRNVEAYVDDVCWCFTTTPTKGYPRGGEFVGSMSPRSGTRRCKEHKV
jgi:hypothetical protein